MVVSVPDNERGEVCRSGGRWRRDGDGGWRMADDLVRGDD